MDDVSTTGDGELWRRAGDGDPDSFAILFDRHVESVRSYCARRTGSLDAAEDLVSIVFLEAWRRRNDVELLHDSALPWLYGVASHTISHRLRTSLRHRRALTRLPPAVLEPDHAEDVAARLDDQRRVQAAHRALAGLTRADQEVLLLCLWQELDYAAASVALGVPVGTVRSRLSRARVRLRTALQEPSAADGPDHRTTRTPADGAAGPGAAEAPARGGREDPWASVDLRPCGPAPTRASLPAPARPAPPRASPDPALGTTSDTARDTAWSASTAGDL